jgi:hypothetical protein
MEERRRALLQDTWPSVVVMEGHAGGERSMGGERSTRGADGEARVLGKDSHWRSEDAEHITLAKMKASA